MTSRPPLQTVTLPNGRTVTQGTAWWVNRASGTTRFKAGDWLRCVHDVALAERCERCAKQ